MKDFYKILISITVLMLSPVTSQADGNQLLGHCLVAEKFIDSQELTNELSLGTCVGLVQGVRHTIQLMGNDGPIKVCFPKSGIDNAQATRIVVSYLKNNPDKLHKDEVYLIISAFVVAYPCR